MSKQNIGVYTAVIATVLVLGVGLFLNTKSSTPSPVTNIAPIPTTDAGTVAISSIPENQTMPTTDTQDPTNKCNVEAKKYFDTWNPTGFDDDKTVGLTYQNYYDSQNNSCYVLVNYNFNMKYYSEGSTSLHITYALVDVSKKDPTGDDYTKLGSYSSPANYSRVDECNVSGQQCNSLDSFLALVNPYIGK